MRPAKPQPDTPNEPQSAPQSVWRTLLGPALAIMALAVLGRLAGGHWPAVEAKVVDLGPWGYVLFVVAWVTLSSACFPVSVLGVSAGALFGLPLGVTLVFVSAMLAGLVMFGLARGLLRGRIRKLIAGRPKLAAIDRLAGEQALRLNILTRLSPLNYGLACYTLASGSTSLRAYLVGNLATVPSMVFQVWLGTVVVQTGKSLTGDGASPRNLVIMGAGVLFLGLLTWQIQRMIRQAISEGDPE